MAISIALFAAQSLGLPLAEWGALAGPPVRHGEWWRLLTSALLHGSVLHIAFNLSVVWTLGRGLEGALGSARFALVSLVGALGSAACVLTFAYEQYTLGLSGVLLAWAGVALPLLDRQGRRDMWVWLAQVLVISLLPGVSWAGHLGGFVAGLGAGLAARNRRVGLARALPVVAFVSAVLIIVAIERHP